jgi:hypothetical protein
MATRAWSRPARDSHHVQVGVHDLVADVPLHEDLAGGEAQHLVGLRAGAQAGEGRNA